jgi:hypothetical protein
MCNVDHRGGIGGEWRYTPRSVRGPRPPLDVKQALRRVDRDAENVEGHARAGQITVTLDGAATDLIPKVVDDGVEF